MTFDEKLEALRYDAERRLRDLMREVGDQHREELLTAIATYGSVTAIPEEFWRRYSWHLKMGAQIALRELMADIYAIQAAELSKDDDWPWWLLILLGIAGFAIYRAAKEAGAALDEYTTLLEGLDEAEAQRRTQAELQERAAEIAAAMADQLGDGYTQGVRRRAIKRIDDEADAINELPPENRGAAIDEALNDAESASYQYIGASTTTTTAISISQIGAGDDLGEAYGREPHHYWVTERGPDGKPDERVCKLCRPWDGKHAREWENLYPMGPPIHLVCRCKLLVLWIAPPLATAA